jgi:hypothetical protein
MKRRLFELAQWLLPSLACLALSPAPAQAHHGLDFLIVQTAHLPERGTAFALTRMDYVAGPRDETAIEPALLYGATDRITLETHGHYAKEDGESGQFEVLAAVAHFQLTPLYQPFAAGMSLEYAAARDSSHEDATEVSGVIGYETERWLLAANFLYHKESGASSETGYAAGARYNLSLQHAFGAELRGSLESDGSSEFLLGYYGNVSDTISINLGVGTGVDGGPDWTARSAFIWRFR